VNIFVISLAFGLGAPALKEAPKADPSPVGEWTIEAHVHGGQPDKSLVQSPIEKIVITADRWVVHRNGQPGPQTTLAFDPKAAPPRLDLNVEAAALAVRGIYKLDGDTLTIAYTLKGDRPAKVESPPGSDVWMMTLKRIKK
jgi:uncharacterized protein (TIGR03067 family)